MEAEGNLFAKWKYSVSHFWWRLQGYMWGFPDGSAAKNLPVLQETQVRSLDQEDPLEEGMVTHSSLLAWRIPWTEEPGGLQSAGSPGVGHD